MKSCIYEFKTEDSVGTEKLGGRLAKVLCELGIKRAFIALRGEMGVGKTAFTRGFADFYEIKAVKSPTYSILNEYRAKCAIYHFDMYRIEDGDDLYSVGYDEYLDRDGFVICEWSENIEEFLPESRICVEISRCAEGESYRDIKISFLGEDMPCPEGEDAF